MFFFLAEFVACLHFSFTVLALLLIYLLCFCVSSISQLVHVHEFEEVLKDPALPDYLKGAAIYSISQGRTPALPKLGLKPEQLTDTDTLVRL